MKKTLKKISTLALTMAMVAGMGTAVFAADETMPAGGVIGGFETQDTPVAQESSVLIYKEITAYNAEGLTVNAPAMEYTYAISPGSAGKSVKDAGGDLHATGNAVEVLTKAGLDGATVSGSVDNGSTFTVGSLALTNDVQLNADADGEANKFPIKVDFSGVEWTGAGVYRYEINESTAEGAKTAAGITEGGIAETLFMDVYVKDAAESGYEIYGYVCFKADENIDGTSEASLNAVGKTEGFVTGDTDGDGKISDNEQADKYHTFNLTVSKTLVGDQAMNGHKFPFNVDFTNDSVTASILLKQETVAGGGITANLPAAAGVSGLDVTDLGLANGASVKYIGIPVGVGEVTSVEVYENNDVTGTVYKSSYKVDDGEASEAKSLSWEGDASKSDVARLEAGITDDAHTIAFTNTLEVISPTGVVLRFGPYALMLAGGLALLILAMRRRSLKAED